MNTEQVNRAEIKVTLCVEKLVLYLLAFLLALRGL